MVKSSYLNGMIGKPKSSLKFQTLTLFPRKLLELVKIQKILNSMAWYQKLLFIMAQLFLLMQCHWLLMYEDPRDSRKLPTDWGYVRNDE